MIHHEQLPAWRVRFGRFPFNPIKLPFFYGFAIVGAGTLGMVMSAPGQTIGVSVFTDFLIEALGLSRSGLSLAYLLGTTGSALMLAWAGRIYDVIGGRLLATIAATALGGVLAGLTFIPDVLSVLDGTLGPGALATAAFVLITVGFFLLRFSGQGLLTLASRNMVMEWFEKRRGAANAMMGAAIAFGFSLAPRVFDHTIEISGSWQNAWRMTALVVFGFALFAFLVYRDTPELHGLTPDGPIPPPRGKLHVETVIGGDFTLSEARHTFAYWYFALTVVLAGFLMTAYSFHIVSIFADAGMSRARAVSVFFPAAVVAIVVEITASYLSDLIRLKYLAMLQAFGAFLLAASLALLPHVEWAIFTMIGGAGLMQGLFGVLSNVTWPRFFGRRHLGAISGQATSLGVLGTAFAPLVFSATRDLTGTYAAAAMFCAVWALAIIALGPKANRPDHPAP